MIYEHTPILKKWKLRVRENHCAASKQCSRVWSDFVLAMPGALSAVKPLPACSSHEGVGKAVESYHSWEINFKLPLSLLSDCKAPAGISGLSTPSSEGTTGHACTWPGQLPQSLCQSRHQTGCVWEEEFAADCSTIQVPICVNWVIYGCSFSCTAKETHRTFGNNSISFKGTHLGKLLLMHLSKRCSALTNISCNYSKDETVTTSDHQSFPRSIITMEHAIKPNQHPVIKE